MLSLYPKTNKILSRLVKILGILLVISIVLWFFLINPLLTRQEKQRFEAAAVELEKLAQEIQTKIGPANSVTPQKSCDRPNLKFEKGPLSCDVMISLQYSAQNSEEVNSLTSQVRSFSDEPLRRGATYMHDLVFTDTENRRQFMFQSLPKIEKLSCALSYSYDAKEARKKLELHLSCGGSARAEHYSMAD